MRPNTAGGPVGDAFFRALGVIGAPLPGVTGPLPNLPAIASFGDSGFVKESLGVVCPLGGGNAGGSFERLTTPGKSRFTAPIEGPPRAQTPVRMLGSSCNLT